MRVADIRLFPALFSNGFTQFLSPAFLCFHQERNIKTTKDMNTTRGEKKVLWASEAQREVQNDEVKGQGRGSMQTAISNNGAEDAEPWARKPQLMVVQHRSKPWRRGLHSQRASAEQASA
ncbi:hypothetical protein SRHO_G00065120 [Serrasalmus rhombeus]